MEIVNIILLVIPIVALVGAFLYYTLRKTTINQEPMPIFLALLISIIFNLTNFIMMLTKGDKVVAAPAVLGVLSITAYFLLKVNPKAI